MNEALRAVEYYRLTRHIEQLKDWQAQMLVESSRLDKEKSFVLGEILRLDKAILDTKEKLSDSNKEHL